MAISMLYLFKDVPYKYIIQILEEFDSCLLSIWENQILKIKNDCYLLCDCDRYIIIDN
jgi:hypothetical protein